MAGCIVCFSEAVPHRPARNASRERDCKVKKLAFSLVGMASLGLGSVVYALPTIQASGVSGASEKDCRCKSCGQRSCTGCEIVGIDAAGNYIL